MSRLYEIRQIKKKVILPSSSLESSSSEPDPDSSSKSSPKISALIDLYHSSFSRYLGSNLKISVEKKVRSS
jgi:hypothetical protein